MILKDASNPSEPIEVAKKELPYSFEVRSAKPINEPTGDQRQQTNIGASSSIRRGRRAKHPGPAATPSPPASFRPAIGLHPEGTERRIQPGQMAGEIPDCERVGQHSSSHVSSIDEPEKQSLGDLRHLLSATPVSRFSRMPKPPLLVQPRRGSSGGGGRDSLEDGQGPVTIMHSEGSLGINALQPTSDAGAPHTPDGSTRKGRPYSALDIPRQQKPSPFALVHHSSFQSPHIPTTTERNLTRAKIAEREVQIQALEMKISYLLGPFAAEGQEKFPRLQPIMGHLNSRILSVQKGIADRLNVFLAEREEAEAAVNAKVAGLEAQIHTLKQETPTPSASSL